MPRHTKHTHTSKNHPGTGTRHTNSPAAKAQAAKQQRDAENERRFVDRTTEGQGIAAQDLPGAGHGQNVVDSPEQMTRLLPQQHGGEIDAPDNYEEGGLRADRNISEASRAGGRKKN